MPLEERLGGSWPRQGSCLGGVLRPEQDDRGLLRLEGGAALGLHPVGGLISSLMRTTAFWALIPAVTDGGIEFVQRAKRTFLRMWGRHLLRSTEARRLPRA